jgi:pimeloyl-ACP methyl ester carboxylesterase
MGPVEKFCSVGGLRLYYLNWGAGGMPPLVLLHGLGQSADAWRPVASALARDFHVVAPDLRGHGDSDWIDTYSPQEQADDIGELITVLGLMPAAVLGTGVGARAALLLAARQEHTVSRVAAVGVGVHMYLPAEREAAEAILSMPRVYDSPEDYLQHWHALRATLGLTHRAAPLAEPDVLAGAERALRRLPGGGYAPKFDADGYQRYRAWSPGERTVDYHDEFSQIACPVLLVVGADSPIIDRTEADETAAVIPDCRVVEVPGARHDVLADNPAGLLDVVLPFLKGENLP